MFNNRSTWTTITEDGFKVIEPDNKTTIDQMAEIEELTDYEFSFGQEVDGTVNQIESDIIEVKNNVLRTIKGLPLVLLGIGTIYLLAGGKNGK